MAMALTADGSLYARIRHLVPELLKFGVVGGIGSVIDLCGAAVLNSDHASPITAKAISVTAATVFTYVGSRFWTFKHRENQPSVTREATLFIVLNVVGLIIAEAVISVVTYVMGLRGTLEYNAASLLGTGLGTIFRFYAYRKWVFTAPAAQPALAAGVMRQVPEFPDYPPWELNEAYLAPAYAPPTAPAYAAPAGPAYAPPTAPAYAAPAAPPTAPAYAAPAVPPAAPAYAAPAGPAYAPPTAPAYAAPAREYQPSEYQPREHQHRTARPDSPRPAPAGPRTPGRHRRR